MLEDLEVRPRPYFLVTTAVPATVGIATGFSSYLGCLLFLICLPVLPFALLALVIAQGARSIHWIRADARSVKTIGIAIAVPLLMLVSGPAVAYGSMRLGQYLGEITSLAINMRLYRAIITDAERSTPKEFTGTRGWVSYQTDPGPPLRVAFEVEGFLDNWSGIIYDPSGRVMEADGWDALGKFRAPEKITKLFGGDLVGCRHLWGDFYSCSFT